MRLRGQVRLANELAEQFKRTNRLLMENQEGTREEVVERYDMG
jgi:hypothetical protein